MTKNQGPTTRTTLVLDARCMKKLRQMANDSQRTISDLVNELLAEGIQRHNAGRPLTPAKLPTFSMGEARVDLANRHALENLMGD